ncbi:MAG: alanine racemase [candidate division Zixibacteria bacterium]|nr:alanine racemase [candidate division Zixibacteria bacterium]
MLRPNRFNRPSYIEVNLDKVASNVRNIKDKLPQGTLFQAVVKSNGYGHGALETARVALENGADYLGVAFIEEGIELREAGIHSPIAVLYPEPPERSGYFVEFDLIPTISSVEFAESLNRCVPTGAKKDVYLKVDTGMSRYGPYLEELDRLAGGIGQMERLNIAGVSSNFSMSDYRDKSFSAEQLGYFHQAIEIIKGHAVSPLKISIANSGAVLDIPESYFNMVRVGLLLYGYYPSRETTESIEVRPAMRLISRVLYLRELEKGQSVGYGRSFIADRNMLLATLPIGYGDGYPRILSNKGEVLIHGQRAPIIGRICMDALMVDVSRITGVEIGDEVVLIGSQGGGYIGADELARLCDTITWEITCGLTSRLPIEYHYRDVISYKDEIKSYA